MQNWIRIHFKKLFDGDGLGYQCPSCKIYYFQAGSSVDIEPCRCGFRTGIDASGDKQVELEMDLKHNNPDKE